MPVEHDGIEDFGFEDRMYPCYPPHLREWLRENREFVRRFLASDEGRMEARKPVKAKKENSPTDCNRSGLSKDLYLTMSIPQMDGLKNRDGGDSKYELLSFSVGSGVSKLLNVEKRTVYTQWLYSAECDCMGNKAHGYCRHIRLAWIAAWVEMGRAE